MNSLKNFSTTVTLVAASLALTMWASTSTSSFAQEKGAERLVGIGSAKSVATSSAHSGMACGQCQDVAKPVAENPNKAATHGKVRLTAMHQCGSCVTTIGSVGHGKMSKTALTHGCQAGGGAGAKCCAN